ncbi:hypothetical protein [Salinarimonas soli]|uniref:Uncharacterized protein n=1 Tax=Salinarimonas soli TaxID=1638099 RepID=A0A5B2VDQ5_9HYPH|nr:hypothetical protein [Salinarimonas soli]KAA2236915.1 hypothetical protein F0L46_13070 [Salinarimonas soli]
MIGDRVARGDTFRPDVIRAWAGRVEASLGATCDVPYLTHGLFILMKALEVEREQADLAALDRRTEAARSAAVRTLTCAPTHSFAWLSLYWIDTARLGAGTALQGLLAQSYRTGPKEMWIAVRRNPLAMNIFEELSPELQLRAVDEFLDLVQVAPFDFTAAIFTSLAPETQAAILPRLAEVPIDRRRFLARRLESRGLELEIPGLPARDERPWRR